MALFLGASRTLERFFSHDLVGDIALSLPPLTHASPATTTEERISGSISAIYQIHNSFVSLVGESRQRGEPVPTMSYFAGYVQARGKTADSYAHALAEEISAGRAFDPEDTSKEAVKTLLLEFSILNYCLREEAQAFSSFQALLERKRNSCNTALSPFGKGTLLFQNDSDDRQKFQAFSQAVTQAYQHLQAVVGVDIPDNAVQELMEHPLQSKLSTLELDQLRSAFFKLPESIGSDSMTAKILRSPPAAGIIRS